MFMIYSTAYSIRYLKINLLTCGDDTESDLTNAAVDIWRILDLTDISAVELELDISNRDRGITAHDVTRPCNVLPENALWRRIWFLLVVKDLEAEFKKGDLDVSVIRLVGLSDVESYTKMKLELEGGHFIFTYK